jgi:hypothetical protein
MWILALASAVQIAAQPGLTIESVRLSFDEILAEAGLDRGWLDITVTNPSDFDMCIQSASLDPSRFSVLHLAAESQSVRRLSTRHIRPESVHVVPAQSSLLVSVDLSAVHPVSNDGRYRVEGELTASVCAEDEYGRARWPSGPADARFYHVSYLSSSDTSDVERVGAALELQDVRFDGERLILRVRNSGETASCVVSSALEPSYVRVFDVRTGRRVEAAGHPHMSRSLLTRIEPGAESELRLQIEAAFDLDSASDYRFSGSFEYAPCDAFRRDSFGFARAIDGLASELTYSYGPEDY